MRPVPLLALLLCCCIAVLHSLPLPAGEIIKYRVSSKYFDRNQTTSGKEQASSEIYGVLWKLHHGQELPKENNPVDVATVGSEAEQTAETTAATVEEEKEAITMMTSNESPETITEEAPTDETEQQESTTTSTAAEPEATDEVTASADEEKTVAVEEEIAVQMTTESSDEETTTTPDEVESVDAEQEQTSEVQMEASNFGLVVTLGNIENFFSVMSDVGSLQELNNKKPTSEKSSIETNEIVDEKKTEKMKAESDRNEVTSEVDEKIENLNAQNTLMTEAPAESFTEAVKVDEDVVMKKHESATTLSAEEPEATDEVTEAATESSDEDTTTKSDEQEPTIETQKDENVLEVTDMVADSFLGTVGNFLSSVFGLTESNVDVSESDKNEANEDDEKPTTEKVTAESVSSEETSEVDEKIENLNAQNTLMTEVSPEFVTEAVKIDENTDSQTLEAISPVADEEEEPKPLSIEYTVDRVLSLIKSAVQGDDAQIYTTLKEIGDSLEQTETSAVVTDEADEVKALPANSFDPETVKSFETDIAEAVNVGGAPDDEDNFVPNVAKAGLYHKYEFDEENF